MKSVNTASTYLHQFYSTEHQYSGTNDVRGMLRNPDENVSYKVAILLNVRIDYVCIFIYKYLWMLLRVRPDINNVKSDSVV